MTWHADEFIAAATPAMLQAVQADPRLAASAYKVPASELSRLRAAASSLLIVRPICDHIDNEPALEWYGGHALDSRSFSGAADLSTLREATAAHVGDDAPLPPPGFLAALQDIFVRVGEPLVYYSSAMWGGDIEFEQAFVLSAEPHAYSKLGDSEAQRLPSGQASNEDVLVSALRDLGFELTDPYFEPHTRAFAWERYALFPAAR